MALDQITTLTILLMVVVLIVAVQTVQITTLSQQKMSPTIGLVSAGTSGSGQGQATNQEFSSYEEMMKAHHGDDSQQASGVQDPNQGFSSYEDMMAAHHGGGSGAQQATQDLPTMVGGC